MRALQCQETVELYYLNPVLNEDEEQKFCLKRHHTFSHTNNL